MAASPPPVPPTKSALRQLVLVSAVIYGTLVLLVGAMSEPTDGRDDPTFGEFLVAHEPGRVERVELRTKDNSAHVALLTGTEEEVFGHQPDPRNGELVPGASAAAV